MLTLGDCPALIAIPLLSAVYGVCVAMEQKVGLRAFVYAFVTEEIPCSARRFVLLIKLQT